MKSRPAERLIALMPLSECKVVPSDGDRYGGLVGHILSGAILGALAGSALSVMPNVLGTGLHPAELSQTVSPVALEWIHGLCYRTVLSSWGILGAVVGELWARKRFLAPGGTLTSLTPQPTSSRKLSGPSSFMLAAGSWLLAILMWGWVMTRPPEAFHDQAGMVITFGVLPLTFVPR